MHKLFAVLTAVLLAAPPAHACTTLLLKAKDGAVMSGRTMEFGFDVKSQVMVIPAGTKMTGTLPGNATGITYTTKYGMAGATALGFNVIVDGINEKGLYLSALYFPGYASYTAVTSENASHAMASYEFGNWVLGNFSSVDDVRAHLKDIALVGTEVAALGGPPPLHFIIRDRTGKSIVIEPLKGSLTVYDDPVGVLTNSPTFDWHLTNLQNYVNLRPENTPALVLGGNFALQGFGQGSGLIGLPGDTTPPARFVRAVAFSQSATQSATADETVLQVFHIMNNFDIPYGSVRDKNGNAVNYDYTIWTAVADLKNDRWYFRTYTDQTIREIDLQKALAASNGKIRMISMDSTQPITNISTPAN